MWTDYVYVSMLAHFNLHCKHGLWAGVRLIICRLVLRRVELTTSLTTNWNVKKLDNKIMFTNKQKNHTWSIIYWRYNNLQFPHLPTLTQQWPDRTQEVSIPSSSDHLFTKGRRLLVKQMTATLHWLLDQQYQLIMPTAMSWQWPASGSMIKWSWRCSSWLHNHNYN